ncbi:MAG: acyltransferase family protein [Erysipelotrichaceae bacterium]|nr:acyltransferase family protein [Erysipelotrichaceae bacterium]
MSNKRFEEIDLIKALGIILIVAGHAGFPHSAFINFFHVSLFFIASGYVYKPDYASDIQTFLRFVWRKIRFLCFPYYLYNGILSLFHNFWIRIGFYSLHSSVPEDAVSSLALTDYWNTKDITVNFLKGLIFRGDNELIQGIWFIKDLFILSVLYCFIDFLLYRLNRKHQYYQSFLAGVFLLLGFSLDRKGLIPYSLARILSCYSLYHLGTILKENREILRFNRIFVRAAAVIVPIVLFGILQWKEFSVSLVKNRYPDPLFLLLVSFSGWILCYEVSRLIRKTGKLKEAFLSLGRNSYIVLLLHIISFKPVTLLKLSVNRSPLYYLSSIPTFQGEEKGWWMLYLAFGILLPMLYSSIKDKVFKKNQKGI